MREQGLAARRPRHRTITTQSEPGARVPPHLLQRDFSAELHNTKWVADTTYIWTAEGWLCLAVVLDLFSRMVVGWSMAATQDATLVVQALQMAPARRHPQAGLLHHSDRGSTYTSESYQALLQQEGMRASMSRTADCYDNAAMEASFTVSKVNALMVSHFRHEHKLEAAPLNTSSLFIIEQGDTPPCNT
jgi:putative transposase